MVSRTTLQDENIRAEFNLANMAKNHQFHRIKY